MLLLNYKPVLHQPTGIGVYANAVLPEFQKFEHVLLPGGGSGGSQERLKRLVWSQMQLPRLAKKLKADLIFTPAPEGYIGEQSVPQVVMVHDLRPLSHPERSMQSLYFQNWVPPLLRQCRHILTNSNFTASEICRSTRIRAEKISVTPLGYDVDHFYPTELTQRLHPRPYLLHIGQAYPHKNLERLIRTFHLIVDRFPEVDLVLLGKPHPSETQRLQRLTSELCLSERVVFKSYVPYVDLPNWYRGALAFVYPSLWEGFGLPVLEAMACGCPVLTSYGSGTQEAAGNAAYLIDPLNGDALHAGLVALLSEPVLRDSLRALGLQHSKNFSWTQCAERTRHVLNRLT